jgi:peptidyl-prolyl cis-trans isomerase SurA
VRGFSSADLPPVLADAVARTAPGRGFTQAVPEAGGIVVGLVSGTVTPTFAEVRDQLAQQAGTEADQAGAAVIGAFQDDVDITVNPRYGTLEEGQIVPAEGGVVHLLEDTAAGTGQGAGAGPVEGSGD